MGTSNLVPIATHYERLGVSAEAETETIRAAYRTLARRHHPDAHGGNAAPEMADINEAWRVLSDPGRRAVYDATLRRQVSAPAWSTASGPEEMYRVPASAYQSERRLRFPFWPAVVLVVLAAIFVFTAGAMDDGPSTPPTDGLLRPGECVTIETNGDAAEVPCDGPHDAVVEQFVTLSTACPIETREHRDKQGMGKVCVTPR